MFQFLRDMFGTSPPEFKNGDIARLKVNPTIKGMVSLTAVPCGFGAISFDYNLRREDDGSLITGLRAHELELDQ